MGFIRYGRFIDTLHLELSSRCNLACPGCPRTFNPLGLEESERLNDNLSLARLKELFNDSEIAKLKSVYGCGTIGDPAMSPEIFDIFSYIRNLNQSCFLGISTNGALRNEAWWRKLAVVLGPNQGVVFGIDGLEDTNHLYRVNAVWSKVMANAKAYIEAGGNATWAYLVFEHNKHQVEQARSLAKEMGFKAFETRYSHRPDTGEVKYVRGDNFKVTKKQIECVAIRDKELYIDARGKVFPCCRLGNVEFHIAERDREINFDDEHKLNWIPVGKKIKTCEKFCTVKSVRDDETIIFDQPGT